MAGLFKAETAELLNAGNKGNDYGVQHHTMTSAVSPVVHAVIPAGLDADSAAFTAHFQQIATQSDAIDHYNASDIEQYAATILNQSGIITIADSGNQSLMV